MVLKASQLKMVFLGLLLATLLLLQVACEQSVSVAPKVQDQCYCLEEVVSDLYPSTGAHFVVGGKGREEILVVEQRGVIRSVYNGKTDVFMDIRDRVYVTNDMGDSRGLLSMALSPKFGQNGLLYVYYIRKEGSKEYAYISQFQSIGGKVDSSTERFLLRVYQPYKHGNGGPMLFGDDGFLYIVIGDGGAEDDLLGNAQNKNSFHGSILRIDVENDQAFVQGESGVAKMYAVPEDNPFWNKTDAMEEIFAFGLRNPWGCSVDSNKNGGDGRIYCVDTGTDKFDEVNIIEKGKNYGWNIKEGHDCLNATTCKTIENEGKPMFEYQHIAMHALVGGFVYRGDQLEWMKDKGYYTFADIVTGETFYLEENTTTRSWQIHGWSLCEPSKCPLRGRDQPLRHIFAFAQDNAGELYFLMVDMMKAQSQGGKMYKLLAASSSSTKIGSSSVVLLAGWAVTVVILIKSFWITED